MGLIAQRSTAHAASLATSAYLDSTLKTTITARNWRTVLKLVEMLNAPQ